MPTITAGGTPQTITLPEGQALNISGTAGAAGVVYRLDPVLGGTNSLQSWVIGAGALPVIGPYEGTEKFLIACSAGSVSLAVHDAVLSIVVPQIPVEQMLREWSGAVACARNGTANALILVLGESTIAGSGASGTPGYSMAGRNKSYVPKLAKFVADHIAPARADFCWGAGNTPEWFNFDPRYSHLNWPVAVNNPSASGGGSFLTTTVGAELRFSPGTIFDRLAIYTTRAPDGGSMEISIDGGAPVTVSNQGEPSYISHTISAPRGTHTVTCKALTTDQNQILGFRTWDSTVSEIEFVQWGVNAATALYFTNEGVFGALAAIDMMRPKLTIINLDINDSFLGTPLTDYTVNMQAIIDTARAHGSVMIGTGGPSGGINPDMQTPYIEALRELAKKNNLVFQDQYGRVGSHAAGVAAGLFSDSTHFNGNGYDDMARATGNILNV